MSAKWEQHTPRSGKSPERGVSGDWPFSRKRRLCAVCESITFFVRMDGVAVCPRHMDRHKKKSEPTRKDRDGEMRAS